MHTSIDQYLASLQEKGRAAGTLRMVTQDLRQFVAWWEQKRGRTFDPSVVRFEDLRDWRNSRQQERKAASTINRSLTVLRGYFNWSIANKLIRVNPAKNLKDIPLDPLSPRSLPPDAVDALLREALLEPEAVIRLRNQVALVLLVYTGLRVQEVCNVQIRDLDMAAGVLIVRGGKRNKSRRVPLHPDAQRVVQEYLDEVRCPAGHPTVGSETEGEPLLIRKEILEVGQPFKPGLDQRTLQRLIRTLGKQAALRLTQEAQHEPTIKRAEELSDLARRLNQVTPHMLRHSLAKRLLDRGAKLTEVQRLLGHSRLDTTARYLTPSEDDLREAILRTGL